MIIACHCTDHEIELLEEKLKNTGLESLEVCKFFPYGTSFSSPLHLPFAYVVVPGGNQTLFRCIFQLC